MKFKIHCPNCKRLLYKIKPSQEIQEFYCNQCNNCFEVLLINLEPDEGSLFDITIRNNKNYIYKNINENFDPELLCILCGGELSKNKQEEEGEKTKKCRSCGAIFNICFDYLD
jgi:uncharacterized protein YbaR (Trm112 family)